jgi:hypothetical protein
MEINIFFSWQSDIKAAANRSLIQNALESAVNDLRSDNSILVEPVVDRDTLDTPGSPDIVSTIFEKIDNSSIFVADITIINKGANSRLCPNPNVLIELGYAFNKLTNKRIVLVQNTAFGEREDLPFDIRQKRILAYNSPEDSTSRVGERKYLQNALREAIAIILAQDDFKPKTQYPTELEITYKKIKSTPERHDYDLKVFLKNKGTKPISEWHVDIEVPTKVLPSNVTYPLKVDERSDHVRSLFRSSDKTHGSPIYPGDSKLVLALEYYVDNEIFQNKGDIFEQKVAATAYVHGELAATNECSFRELQNF